MIRHLIPFIALMASGTVQAGQSHGPVSLDYFEPLQLLPTSFDRSVAAKTGLESRLLTFDAFGQRFDLELIPNRSLSESRSAVDGVHVAWTGSLRDLPESWARISFVDGAPQGVIFDGQTMYAVEKHTGLGDTPVVFRLSDLQFADGALGCPVHKRAHSGEELLQSVAAKGVPDSARAFGATQQIDIGVLGDSDFAGNQGAGAESAIVARMNTVDGIFSEQLGLQFNIADLEIFNAGNDPFTDQTDASDLLDEVRSVRTNSSEQRGFGLTHLFTGRNLDGSTAGIAFLDVVCSSRFGVGLTQATFGAVTDALIAAHEFGHNFAAPHDGEAGEACESESESFLMAPRVSNSSEFSNCSIQIISQTISQSACISALSSREVSLSSLSNNARALADTAADLRFSALNAGTAIASNVTITVPVSSDLELVSASSDIGTCSTTASNAECTVSSLAPNAAMEVTVSVSAPNEGTRSVSATVSSSDDTNSNNNDVSADVFFEAAVDLQIVGSSVSVEQDSSVDISAALNNLSDDQADAVEVTLTPDAGLTIDAASWSGVGTCTVVSNVATCQATSVAALAQSAIDATISATETGTRSVAVSVTTTTTDTNVGNDSGAVTVTVNAPASAAPPPPITGGAGGGDSGGGGSIGWLLAWFALILGRRKLGQPR